MATATMRTIREVGRYAVGIDWSDGHDSILPYRHLRQACPCDRCLASPGENPTPEQITLARMQAIGATTLFLAWADRHETLFVAEELRALCRCAHCIGEPDYPITGR
jgi:DUF971 family protein